jgi:hypothetical protein
MHKFSGLLNAHRAGDKAPPTATSLYSQRQRHKSKSIGELYLLEGWQGTGGTDFLNLKAELRFWKGTSSDIQRESRKRSSQCAGAQLYRERDDWNNIGPKTIEGPD